MRGVIAILLALMTVTAAQASAKPDYDFSYVYPAAAARIAPLRAWLEAERVRRRSAIAHDAAGDRADSKTRGFAFHTYQESTAWQVVTDTPRFLSLSAERSSYFGGAHGQYEALSLVWDKRTGRRLDPATVFVSAAAVQAVFGAPWCAWLKGERAKRTGSSPTDDDTVPCPEVKTLTLLLGSSDRRRIDRIGLIASPYVAGSYAEGTYETTLPVTADVLRIVKPAYRADFALR